MFFPFDVYEKAERVVKVFRRCGKKIAVAESCTGGLLAAALTSVPGSSSVFDRGFVTYNDDAKRDMLGIVPDLLERYGAVSDVAAEAMAGGALDYSRADCCVSITGIAGPSGGRVDQPVGLVFLGVAQKKGTLFHQKCQFSGDRDTIRLDAVREALRLLEASAEDDAPL